MGQSCSIAAIVLPPALRGGAGGAASGLPRYRSTTRSWRCRGAPGGLRAAGCATPTAGRSTRRPATCTWPTWAADLREEITYLPEAEIAGANLGWHCFEGTRAPEGLQALQLLPARPRVPERPRRRDRRLRRPRPLPPVVRRAGTSTAATTAASGSSARRERGGRERERRRRGDHELRRGRRGSPVRHLLRRAGVPVRRERRGAADDADRRVQRAGAGRCPRRRTRAACSSSRSAAG